MKKTCKRVLALITTLCMLAALMPTAFAALPTSISYIRDSDGVDSGAVYAIYTSEDDGGNSNRILYHTGTGKTDKVTGSVSGDELTLNGGFAASRQLWTITAVKGGYTVQSVDSGYYLDLSQASTANFATSGQAVVLTIEFDEETELYTIVSGESYLSFNPSGNTAFLTDSTGYGLRFYKQTEVLPGMAPGADSGTSAGQPFVKEDTDSRYFRIPALLTLDNGWIVAAADIRWRTSADSPQNLDTIVSISKDGGETWDWEVVNYYDDMVDTATGQGSASFIDPSILQAEDGTVHMVVDACPSYVGLMGGNRMGRESSGFDGQGRLLVTLGTAGGDASTSVADYTYYVDINNAAAGESKTVNGEAVILYPVCAADDSQTGVWVDAWLNVYVEEESIIVPDLCLQLQSANAVQSNLFYRNSQWKAYPVFYIMHRSATVTADGLEWSDPTFLDIKLSESEAFTGVCPGRGLSFQYEGHERLVFPLYDNATGPELASVIYSDDGGLTWTRGEHNDDLNGVGKTSESQVVALPDGTLRMYSRNTIDYISYADSADGGVTWGTCQKDMDLVSRNPGNGCMVSFINLDGILVDPDNTVYENLILASYPVIQRTEGVVRIGYIDDSNVVHWLNDDATRYQGVGNFSYSCVTQLPELDTFGILYEYGNETNTIHYESLTVRDLLGEGWFLLDSAGSLPSVSLEQSVVDLEVGESATLTATYSPANAEVVWTSSNEEAATVDGGVITAVAPGAAVITVSVTSGGITRTASADVAVQGGDSVVLPERYTDQVEEIYHEAATTYELDTDGIDSGSIYAIFHAGSSRTLYHANGGTTTDHVTGNASDGLLKLDSGYAATRQTWTVTGDAETGYTIQSCDGGKYLNLNAVTNAGSKVPVTAEAQALTIAPADGAAGSYTVSRVVDDQALYLAHQNTTTQHYVSTEAVPFQFYLQVNTQAGYTYATSVSGLEALIADLSALSSGDYTSDSWAALQTALTAAQTMAAAGSQSFDTQDAAQAAQAVIDQAAADLYAAKLDLAAYTGGSGTVILPSDTPGTGSGTGSGSQGGAEDNTDDDTVIDEPDAPLAELPFLDVSADAWYAEAVAYVSENGLMVGTSDTAFSPNATTTRAMVATILYRIAGSPALEDENLGYPYADVTADSWYGPAVYWARLHNVVNGVGNNLFDPNTPVTREQLVTMFYRYAQMIGLDVTYDTAAADGFSDSGAISAYAREAMAWAVDAGLITGMGGNTLAPQGTATRAQVAAILMRFNEATA